MLTRRTLLIGLGATLALPSRAEALPADRPGPLRTAALDLIAAVPPERRDDLVHPFASTLRHDWHYRPRRRAGLTLRDMDANSRDAALALLRAFLGRDGYDKATGVIALADVLAERGRFGGGSGNYAVAVFGDPDGDKPWGWRIEGHHLSLHFTLLGDRIVSATPHCVCADPTEVTAGRHAGLKPLDREEYMARDLARDITPAQLAKAAPADGVPSDVGAGPGAAGRHAEPTGLSYADLTTETQRHLLLGLAETYVANVASGLARAEMAELHAAGLERLHFVWAGSLAPGRLHYYRLHGPTLLIEYSTRDRPDHVHTLWRKPGRDFGRTEAALGANDVPAEA